MTNLLSSISKSFGRELKRMLSRPIYFIGTILIMTFCYVFFLAFFEEGQPNKMPIGIVDNDNSSLSQTYARNLNATQQANIVLKTTSHKEAREEMQKGNIYAFVEINKDYSKNLISNRRPTLNFYVNGTYLSAGSLLLKDISYMSKLSSGAVQRKLLRAKGVEEYSIRGIIQPLVLNTHLIGNPWANYGIYLSNLVLPGVLQLVILMMTIFAIGIEFKERTSHSWLKHADNSIFAGIAGKLLPYTIIFTIVGIIGNILLYRHMQYPINSSIYWMFLNTFLYVLAYQAIGVFFIGLSPVLINGVTMSAFYGLLGFTFSGFTFPIEQLPYMSRIFSELFPIRHYFNIYVNQALHGTEIRYSIMAFVALLAFNTLPILVHQRLKKAAILQNNSTK